MKTFILMSSALLIILLLSFCEPLVTTFKDTEEGVKFKANDIAEPTEKTNFIKIMTWNIRFAAADLPWFGDSCGDRVILSAKEVYHNLARIAEIINEIRPDILIVNEIDVESKRTAYINQIKYLLNHTYFNYAAYASAWKSQFIPSDGLGRMNTGVAVFSQWRLKDVKRIKLPLRGDQDDLTTYFYLRKNILKTRIEFPGLDNLFILATHLSAFSTDDTKLKQVIRFMEIIDETNSSGGYIIAGGDFNLLPPGSDSTDFCMEDICPGESFHGPKDKPKHKEGSNYLPEITWMQGLYDNYFPAVPLSIYLENQTKYFTHSTDPNRFWDRKLDYLFSNKAWAAGSDSTYQELREYSDHAPVSALWEVPQ